MFNRVANKPFSHPEDGTCINIGYQLRKINKSFGSEKILVCFLSYGYIRLNFSQYNEMSF